MTMYRVLPLAAVALLLGAPAALAGAKPALKTVPASASATVQQILDGNELYIDTHQARVRQQARPPQLISTGNSRGQLGFSSGAVGRLNRESQLRLGSRCFLLDQGEVLISGKQAGCTRSVRLSVRGTNYVLGLNAAGETALSVLEGDVGLQLLRDGAPTDAAISNVVSGQRLELSPTGEVLLLSRLQADDYAALLQGPLFTGFAGPLPEQAGLDRYLKDTHPNLTRGPAASSSADRDTIERMRRMVDQLKAMNRELDRRTGGSAAAATQPPADPRMEDWKRSGSCYADVQAYNASLARVYHDWAAPKPSHKGHFVTRVDFNVYSDGRPAAGFEITQRSGEAPQDRSAYAEAIRKSAELPRPPACVGDQLRVYHQFIVDYF